MRLKRKLHSSYFNSYFFSTKAKLLKQLGLKDVIEIDVLISLANKAESPEKRSKILAYFIENYERAYKDTYRPSAVALPFLPCIMFESKDAVILATPTDCFSDPACIVMGFKAIVPELYPHATEKFRVRVNPPPDMLVDFLKKSPPGEGKAPIIFSYLASRGAGKI